MSRRVPLACIFSATLRQFCLKYIQYYCAKLPSFGEKSAARSAYIETLNRLLRTAKPHRLFNFPTPFKASMGTLYNISRVLSSPRACVSVSVTFVHRPNAPAGGLPTIRLRRIRAAFAARFCGKAAKRRQAAPKEHRAMSLSAQNAFRDSRVFPLGAQPSIGSKIRTAAVQTAQTRIPARPSCRCLRCRRQDGHRGEARARPRPPRAAPR